MEPIYDGLHGIHRAIFKVLNIGELWYIFLIKRLLYTFSWASWLGGKYLVELRECITALMKNHPEMLRKLFDLFAFGMSVDFSDHTVTHGKD